MTAYDNNDFDAHFRAEKASRRWKVKGLRFLRYLSTRPVGCWGFFIAGLLIGKIIL